MGSDSREHPIITYTTEEHLRQVTAHSHTSGDEDAFYSVALQVAAREARQGHHRLVSDIKRAVGPFRQRAHTPLATVTAHR